MERVIVYIDGFNLYFGICDKGWRRYLWLDLPALATRLLTPGQQLVATKYFTARVRADPGKIRRQSTYLQALEARGGLGGTGAQQNTAPPQKRGRSTTPVGRRDGTGAQEKRGRGSFGV